MSIDRVATLYVGIIQSPFVSIVNFISPLFPLQDSQTQVTCAWAIVYV